MTNYDFEELLLEEKIDSGKKSKKNLILFNDDVHSFDYVIDSLVEICKHDSHQAEQCAMITHHKGKCDVKSGTYNFLKPMKDLLIDRKLTVEIE